MERELNPDYAAEDFYRFLIPEFVFDDIEKNKESVQREIFYQSANPCTLGCDIRMYSHNMK